MKVLTICRKYPRSPAQDYVNIAGDKKEGSGSGRGNISSGREIRSIGKGQKERKEERKKGATRGAKGTKAGAPSPFTAREVSRDRGNFFAFARDTRLENRHEKQSRRWSKRFCAVPRCSASGITRRNKKIGAYFPHIWIVSSISDVSVCHEGFSLNLIPI